MSHSIRQLVAREDSDSSSSRLSPAAVDVLIALLALLLVALLLVGGLLLLRRRRQAREELLPFHNNQVSSAHPHLTISTSARGKSESVLVYDEKRSLIESPPSSPNSPVPEIRITFPEEEDETGKRKSARMVVVRISESGGIGLEPCQEALPPYQANESGQFYSLDLERLGGLKEKPRQERWS